MAASSGIDSIVIKGDSDYAVLWLHGYGANAWDLRDFAELLDPERRLSHYFLNAPLDLYGMGPRGPRAWFPLSLKALEKIESQGGLSLAQQGHQLVDEVLPVIDFFLEDHEINPDRLILGGFSQGSIVSLYWLLKHGKKIPGLVLLSSAPMDLSYIQKVAPALSGQSFYQSHGRQDPVLRYSDAELLAKTLKDAGFQGRWQPFDGGHTVPPEVINSLPQILKNWTRETK